MAADLVTDPVPRRGRRHRVVRWTVLAVAVVVLVPGVLVLGSRLGKDPTLVRSVRIGRPVPEFDLPTVDGGRIRSADLAGKPYVLNFWATWCVPCIREHPNLASFYRKWSPDGVSLIGVLFSDTPENARDWRKDRGGDWPIVSDPGTRLALDLGVLRPPETFVVDARGVVVGKVTGPVGRGTLDDLTGQLVGAGGR